MKLCGSLYLRGQYFFLTISFFFILINLNSSSASSSILTPGDWRGVLKLNDTTELPFNFMVTDISITILNAEEKILVDEIIYKDDSVIIKMPVFDSEFRCRHDGNTMNGFFYNHSRKIKNVIPFQAEQGMTFRFTDKPSKSGKNISGKYSIVFEDDDPESRNAVGIFRQEGNRVTGTFLTTTGDYRYLQGEMNGDRLWLSAFDGSHVYLFTAIAKDDSLVKGEFFSGIHYHGPWHGKKNNLASLPPADSLTAMKPGYDKFDFRFPDENGNMVSLSDDRYEEKPVIIQLMGTWCPNCMDETKFLSEWYNASDKRVEIIALDFERIVDTSVVHNNIRRLKKRFNVRYPILFAGSSDKKVAGEALPMLNRVFAFPTTIFLTSDKKVFKIHTGFNGPATGDEYEKFTEWFQKLVAGLN